MITKSFLLLTLLPISVFAAEKEFDKKYYVQGNLGYAMGVAPGGNFEQNTFGSAGVYSAAVGYRFDEHLRADWSLEYRDGYENKFAITDDEGTTDTQTTKTSSLASMINIYYDLAEINKITPYALIGAGVARNLTSSDGNHTLIGGQQGFYKIKNGVRANFAWKAGAGVNYKLSDSYNVGINYQYVDLGIARTSPIFTNADGSIDTDEGSLKGKLKSHEFIAGISYKF